MSTGPLPNLVLEGRGSALSRQRLHFFPGCDGCRPFFYVLINKNACSGFKQFFHEHSPHHDCRPGEGAGEYMRRRHAAQWDDERRTGCPTFVIVRDPADRIASCFIDRLVRLGGQGGGRRLARSIELVVGSDVSQMTFRDFVLGYVLAPGPRPLDPHVRPQIDHLPPGPLRLIELSRIDGYFSVIPGFGRLAACLRDHHNSSSSLAAVPGSPTQPVAELHERWLRLKVLPSPDSLLTAELQEQISGHFADDLWLVDRARQEP